MVGEIYPNNRIKPYTYRNTVSGKRSLVKAQKFNSMKPNDFMKAKKLINDEKLDYKKRGNGNNQLISKL